MVNGQKGKTFSILTRKQCDDGDPEITSSTGVHLAAIQMVRLLAHRSLWTRRGSDKDGVLQNDWWICRLVEMMFSS